MLYINIITSGRYNKFADHWDHERFPTSEYCIEQNSNKDIVWDCVVLFEDFPDEIHLKCKAGGLVYFSGEPPLMHPLSSKYLAQFDMVVCPHSEVKHPNKVISHGFLNWFYGYSFSKDQKTYTFEDLKSLNLKKTKNISIITSSQKMMPGHNLRMRVIEQLKKDFPGQIDYFGKGVNFIDSKRDGIEDYRFHICMENSYIKDYWTEKIADPLLGFSVPIYAGCTNIDDYFKGKGYIQFDIKDYKSLRQIVKTILENPKDEYDRILPDLIEARETLMSHENIIPFIIDRFKHQIDVKEYRELTLYGLKLNPLSVSFVLLRIKRTLLKFYYKFIGHD